MIRFGAVFALLFFAITGCQHGAADCPSGAQLRGKKPPDGQLEWCARPDGVKHGPWREWNANGTPKSAGSYVDGKMEGKWQTFSEDGSLKTEGVYKSGLKDGVWTLYYDKGEGGTKNRVEERHAGSSEVKWTAFRSDGTKWAEGTELGSQPNGPFTEYHANGKVAVKGNYAAGAKTGEWSYFDKEGKPSSTPTGTFGQP
jgi:antitoxin component YwqK of YwqJK toxin-antitoxin module